MSQRVLKDFRGTGQGMAAGAVYKAHLEASQQGGCLWEAQAHAILDLDLTAEVSRIFFESDNSTLRMPCALLYCGLDGCCVVCLTITHSSMALHRQQHGLSDGQS